MSWWAIKKAIRQQKTKIHSASVYLKSKKNLSGEIASHEVVPLCDSLCSIKKVYKKITCIEILENEVTVSRIKVETSVPSSE